MAGKYRQTLRNNLQLEYHFADIWLSSLGLCMVVLIEMCFL